MNIAKLFLTIILTIYTFNVSALENCTWDNKKGIPCVTVSKTPNTSILNKEGINKITITKEDIIKSGAIDTNDILKLIPCKRLNIFGILKIKLLFLLEVQSLIILLFF